MSPNFGIAELLIIGGLVVCVGTLIAGGIVAAIALSSRRDRG